MVDSTEGAGADDLTVGEAMGGGVNVGERVVLGWDGDGIKAVLRLHWLLLAYDEEEEEEEESGGSKE